MMSSISLAKSFAEKPEISVLVLGTGAGTLPMFLQSQLGPKHIKEIVTVDISEDMVKVAEKYFGFMPDEKVKSVIADAHKWVLDCSQKFDMILMDINYEESNINISPPAKFLEQSFLDKLMSLSTGVVCINLVCHDQEGATSTFNLVNAAKCAG